MPRSALTLASNGDVGVRIVDIANTVSFRPVSLVEDDQTYMWVEGVTEGTRIIVQGQDFVREGQRVEAVMAPAIQTAGN